MTRAALIAGGWSDDEVDRLALVMRGGTVLANRYRGHDERLRGWAAEEGKAVYIGRANRWLGLACSDWHNPFKSPRDGDLYTVIAKFATYLEAKPDLLARLEAGELDGKVLECWCYEEHRDVPCHGNVLIARLAARREGRRRSW
jgi:hypothetical protein